MKRTLIAAAALAACFVTGPVRARTHDVAFTFRMGAGFPGDINRTQFNSTLPALMDVTNPVALYGNPVLINSSANSVRGFLLADAGLQPPVQAAASTSTSGGTGLVAATTYYYVVTALNALGETLKSNEISILTGAGATNSNTVNWAAVTGATGYRIYRGLDAGAESQYYTVGAVITYVDTGAAATNLMPTLVNTTAVSKLQGVLVRPYPTQQSTGGMSAVIGAGTPPVTGVVDVLDEGFILTTCNNFAAAPPTKGGAAFVWVAASSGVHVQGGFESVAVVGSTVALSNARFNGPPDAAGVCEIQVWTQ